jgi:hypothetical protein
VDSSKLRSISMFLSNPRQQSQGYFSSRTATVDEDFVVSHGQLPLYKLAAFLDLVTDSRLIRLGNWLLYSEDVDGPLIPESSYATACISPALFRFTAVSQDYELTKKVFKASNDRPLLPSVAFFRALANTNMTFSQYRLVHRVLRTLTKAKAGGFRPENFASLAADILSLETRTNGREHSVAQLQIHEARKVMHNLLEGFYNGNLAVYRNSQIALVQRQLGSLLRILECVPHTSLSKIAQSWRSQFDSGNEVNLHVADFNILFAAILETKGAAVGRTIWDLFCEDPRESFDRNRILSRSYLVPGWTEDDENEWEHGHFLRKKHELSRAVDGYRLLPVVEMDELLPDEVDTVANEAPASDVGSEEAEEERAARIAHERISFDSKVIGNDTPHGLVRTTSDMEFIYSSGASRTTINPVVTPNLRTLRFIVRAALNERRTRQARDQDTSEQQEILEWSKQFFRAFGIRGKAIQQEVQIFTDEDEVSEYARPSLAEEKRLYDQARRKQRLWEPRPVNVSPFFMSGKPGYGCMRPLVKTKKAFDFIPIDLDRVRDEDRTEGKQDEDELEIVQED